MVDFYYPVLFSNLISVLLISFIYLVFYYYIRIAKYLYGIMILNCTFSLGCIETNFWLFSISTKLFWLNERVFKRPTLDLLHEVMLILSDLSLSVLSKVLPPLVIILKVYSKLEWSLIKLLFLLSSIINLSF